MARSGDVQPGAVVLSSGSPLLGASVVDSIATGSAEKAIHSWPRCGSGRVYTSGWMDLAGLLTHNQLRDMTGSPTSQQSIRPVDIDKVWAALGMPRATPFEKAMARAVGGHTTRLARVRLGQASFRRELIERFGLVCAFTGPGPHEALEAAHLYSFATSGEHHPHGGWLMRRDLHQLFDVGHVAVHPDALVVDVAVGLHRFPTYADLHGQRVRIAVEDKHREWLRLHWDAHRQVTGRRRGGR